MKVFCYSVGADTAGQAAALASAFARYRPRDRVDHMCRTPKLGYPIGHPWNMHVARRLASGADVLHLNQTLKALRLFPDWHGKHVVVHQHGTYYREHREAVDAACQQIGATVVASTVDLLGSPGVEWLPVVADLEAIRALRRSWTDGLIRIAHSPTDRAIKGTDAIIDAVDILRAEGLPVELDLIEGVLWKESLARKAQADIFVDQLHLGYGLSAVEAWAVGLPVIVGVDDPLVRARMVTLWGTLPFLEASTSSVVDVLRRLVMEPELRREWGERGMQHAEQFHSQRAVTERLAAIYQRGGARMAA